MENQADSNSKSILLWSFVATILIGSFLVLMFLSKTPPVTPGKLSTPVAEGEWIKGAKDAKVTLVEYSDFQCPACLRWQPTVQGIINEFGAHIRFVYRNYPLRTIHQNAQLAAQAAEAAGLRGKFWEMHDALFANQSAWSSQPANVATSTLADYAGQIGLDVEQFNKDLNSGTVRDAVAEDVSSGDSSGVNSTPSFFLNGTQVNPSNDENFRKLIRDAVEQST